MLFFIIAVTIYNIIVTNGGFQNAPEQIHISFGDDNSKMVVMWTTHESSSNGVLRYGENKEKLDMETKYTNTKFTEGNPRGTQWYHRAKLLNLQPGTRYFYQIVDGNITSDVINFKTLNDLVNSSKIMVYGDLGVNSPFLRDPMNFTRFTDDYAAVIHNGDIGFNLHTDGGKRGDDLMNKIQPFASSIPYMTSPGEHEIFNEFIHYRMRFSMPGTDWPMPQDKLWYSFNVGIIHFVSYSTEVYFDHRQHKNIKIQKTWLTHDLERANASRAERPWIVAFGHRPMYCSNTDYPDCEKRDTVLRAGLENIFYKYGVDLVIQAHEHSYERTWPLYRGHVRRRSYDQPSGPIHVINGAAGSSEGADSFKKHIARWSSVHLEKEAYGSYGVLQAYNASHLQWVQKSFKNESLILDEFWIVQYKHGQFPLRLIPWFDLSGLEFQTYVAIITVCSLVLLTITICMLTRWCCKRGGVVAIETKNNSYQPLMAGSGQVHNESDSDNDDKLNDETTLFKKRKDARNKMTS